jgi:23S rRNA pseudouridine1911/1915/1917 synthase
LATEFLIPPAEVPKRLDVFLAHHVRERSRSAIQRLIEEGRILLNGSPAKSSQKVRPGDRITLDLPPVQPLELKSEPLPLEILYEDEAVLVVNKPAGLVVHPAPGHWTGTLVNALLYHFETHGTAIPTIGGKERPGLVHRLDKDTSGVMVIAKTDHAHQSLAAQFQQHTITRVYDALVWGVPRKSHGWIELAIGRDITERKKFSARTARPKLAVTEYQVVERFDRFASWVQLMPKTGRTHQLRVHMASLGNPLLGDPTYGGRKVTMLGSLAIPRVMLHASILGFTHPLTKRHMSFHTPLPEDMEAILLKLRATRTEP